MTCFVVFWAVSFVRAFVEKMLDFPLQWTLMDVGKVLILKILKQKKLAGAICISVPPLQILGESSLVPPDIRRHYCCWKDFISDVRPCPPDVDIPTWAWQIPWLHRRQFAVKVFEAQSSRFRRAGCTWPEDTSRHSCLARRHRAAAGPQHRSDGLHGQNSSLWRTGAAHSSPAQTRCSEYCNITVLLVSTYYSAQ